MRPLRWGLSILDLHSHAIDERRDHPKGVVKAECGHVLMAATTLHEQPPGRVCTNCAEIQATRAVDSARRRDPGQPPAESLPAPVGGDR